MERQASGRMITGLLVMAIGIALLFERSALFYLHGVWRWWPLLLIGMGVAKLLTPPPGGPRRGSTLVVVGVWFLLDELGIWTLRDSWPIFLVAYGLKIVWNAVAVSAPASKQLE